MFWREKLTNAILLQPRQRIDAGPELLIIIHVPLTSGVDVGPGAEHLDARLDDAGDEEHDEDEAADHHDAGQQAAIGDQDDFDEDEQDEQAADSDAKGEEPVPQSVPNTNAFAFRSLEGKKDVSREFLTKECPRGTDSEW